MFYLKITLSIISCTSGVASLAWFNPPGIIFEFEFC